MSDIQTLFTRTAYTHTSLGDIADLIKDSWRHTKEIMTDPVNRNIAIGVLTAKTVSLGAIVDGAARSHPLEVAAGIAGELLFGITYTTPILIGIHESLRPHRKKKPSPSSDPSPK